MGSERTLKLCMQALVLCNLLFVHMTGAAGMHWLAPLFALTLAAPLLERFRERRVYRVLWNAGLTAVFVLLLGHARRADLAYVLEDGLVLAGLCQVHLLNNLRSSQRPDLLFFNAFLIAIVTGFLNRGIGFPLVFLVFAPCFVTGLQVFNATRDRAPLGAKDTRRLVIDSWKRSGLLLAASLLVFLFWPRDFQRKAFLSGRLDLDNGRSSMLEIGFNEELLLKRKGPVNSSSRPVMSVRLLEGERHQVSPLWRGATLAVTRDGAWHPMEPRTDWRELPLDAAWNGRGGRLSRPGGELPESPVLEVVRHGGDTERLFAPLDASTLDLDRALAGVPMRSRQDGTIEVAWTREVRYRLSLRTRDHQVPPGGQHDAALADALEPFTELPDSQGVQRAVRLAAGLMSDLPEDAPQHALVRHLNDHLSRNFVYLPPGSEGAASSLDEFLLGRSGGHCEFFASALATMLRSLAVPCRVVTGYRSSNWDPAGALLSFHTTDAHAWVEVYDAQAGWYAMDPSPRAAVAATGQGLMARLQSSLFDAWNNVIGFDDQRRAALASWIRAAPGRLLAAVVEKPLQGLAGAILAALPIIQLRRRYLRGTPAAVRALRRALSRAKLRARAGETPRELLTRARTQGVSGTALRTLELAIDHHECDRYGSRPLADFESDGEPALRRAA